MDKSTEKRYLEKICLINNQDPYKIPDVDFSRDPKTFPAIQYEDIVNYCVFAQSAYTLEDFKSYKSLEAYNQFVSGWVSDVAAYAKDGTDKILVKAKVKHSQSLNKQPLLPWVITTANGVVLAGHCNCMAGLGETCTHVSALLFAVDAAVRLCKSRTVTQDSAYWMLPSSVDRVPFSTIQDINFKSARTMKHELECSINQVAIKRREKQSLPEVPEPTTEDLETLFNALKSAPHRPSILAVVPKLCDDYIPKTIKCTYPWMSVSLFDENCVNMEKVLLFDICSKVFKSSAIQVTQEACDLVANDTILQANSRVWHRFRAGRITASNVKRVCSTSIDNPALSVIKNICYPGATTFKSKATDWGCQHEKIALQEYNNKMHENHLNVNVERVGLILNPNYPFMGCSPDSMVSCDCCGKGVVEVKCPYCVRDKGIDDWTDKNSPLCLTDEKLSLKENHAHYYQVQTQLFICNVPYADYVLWSNKDIVIVRVSKDKGFWESVVDKCKTFFQRVILPELIGMHFTRPNTC